MGKHLDLGYVPVKSKFQHPPQYPGPRGFSYVLVRAVREPRSGEHESRSSKKDKPLVTLDLNLTFMQTPAVKRVNLSIQNGTNGSLAIACLSAADVSTRVVRSGIF